MCELKTTRRSLQGSGDMSQASLRETREDVPAYRSDYEKSRYEIIRNGFKLDN